MHKTDPTTLVAALILIALFGIIFLIWFSRKYSFANILLFLTGIQRYYIGVDFALKPYLIFGLFLSGGLILKRNIASNFSNLIKILRPISIPFLVFVVSLMFSGLVTGMAIKSVRQYILLFWGWMIVCSYLLYVQRSKDILNTCRALLRIGALLSVIGIVAYTLYLMGFQAVVSAREGHGLIYKYFNVRFGRLRCFETDPNAYGLYLLPIFFISFGLTLFERLKRKRVLVHMVLTSLLFVNVVLTYSRGAILSLLATVGLALLFMKSRLTTRVFVFGILAFILLVGLPLSDTDFFTEATAGYTFRRSFVLSRMALWNKTLVIVSSNFVWGIGQGRLAEYQYWQAHNAWLELLAENGIFALFSMMWMLTVVIWKAMSLYKKLYSRNDGRAYLLMGGICGLVSMVIMLSSVSMISAIYFWFQIGFLLSMIYAFSQPEET
jgi:hypothetical protein